MKQKPIKNILVTGSSGFIGFHLIKKLLLYNYNVTGVDNHNDYYDPLFKESRLNLLNKTAFNSSASSKFFFFKEDICNLEVMESIFSRMNIDCVVNLAAQAGVRYSLENPKAYIDSNINGFFNILELCKKFKIKHLLFASSSSVYGMNSSKPFSISEKTDSPISLYAATKKSNELMAFTYSHLYKIPITGLRLFTVYGTHGRPDMAYYKFTKSIIEGKKIEIYNEGKMKRDFTHIDDITEGIAKLIHFQPLNKSFSNTKAEAPYELFNIGNNNPITLKRFIKILEDCIGKKAKKIHMEMQPGDVLETFADIDSLKEKINFLPSKSIEEGLKEFVGWYKEEIK